MIPGYEDKTSEEVKEDLEHVLELAAARQGKQKLSYEDLHNLTGFSKNTLQRWRKEPDFKPMECYIEILCNRLGISPAYFKLHSTVTEEDRMYIANQERGYALGLDPAFLEYLKSKDHFDWQIGGMIEPAPEGYGTMKFQHVIPPEDEEVTKDGVSILREKKPGRIEERYPDRTTALVIRLIQSKAEQLIRETISEYWSLLRAFPDESIREKITASLNQRYEELEKEREDNQSMY